MVKLKWLGADATRVRSCEGAEKFDVKPNGTFEADDRMAKYYGQMKEFEVVTQEVKKQAVAKAEVKEEVVEEVTEPKPAFKKK